MIIRRYAFIIIWFVTAVITTGVMAESPLSSDIKSSEELYQQLLSLQAQKSITNICVKKQLNIGNF